MGKTKMMVMKVKKLIRMILIMVKVQLRIKDVSLIILRLYNGHGVFKHQVIG